MAVKKKITITGKKLHDIGYRYFLMENALAFGIDRFRVINTEKEEQIVEVYIEADDETVKEFCEFAKTSFPADAVVGRVEVEDYTGYVPRIEAFALVFNIGQSRKFIEYGKQVLAREDMALDKHDKMLERQDRMLEKQDKMLEKQDGTIRAVKEVGEKVERVAEKVDDVGEGVDALRMDTKSYLDERFRKLETEIERIKEAVGLK